MKLMEEGRIGPLILKNRVIMTPMGMYGIPDADGGMNARGMRFYLERARGGTALIFPAAALVTTAFEAPCTALNAFDSLDKAITWSRLAEQVHHHGARLGIQLTGGLGRTAVNYFFDPSHVPVSASPVPAHWTPWVTCRALEVDDIKQITAAFGNAAALARSCGIDAIEIHGYGGYLLDQFMTPLWNRREDEYGGDLEARMRFPLEVLRQVKEVVDGVLPVIFKMTPVHHVEGGRSLDEGLRIARMLDSAGVDAIHVDVGCYESWHRAIPPVYEPQAPQADVACAVRSVVSVPVIANGKLGDPEVAEAVLADGKADFIGLGRPHLADPEWANKVSAGRYRDIVPCIGCSEGCIARGFKGRYASCAVNPACAMEDEYRLVPAPEPRHVLVIGGGPAGMTAAVTAARRGHRVSLWEKRERLGGCLNEASAPAFKRDVRRLLDHLAARVDLEGISVRTGMTPTAEEVAADEPDAVILAIGARPAAPEGEACQTGELQALDVLSGDIPEGERILVAGGGVVGCEAAMFLADLGKKVAVADPVAVPGGEPMFMLNQASLIEMMDARAIERLAGAQVVGAYGSGAVLMEDGNRRDFDCDSVVFAVGSVCGDVASTLAVLPRGVEIRVIGDAARPGKVLDAIWEGFHAGRLI